jgi:probable rRNA maturation factor
MKLTLDISAPSSLWRKLPRARTMARETVMACVAASGFEAPEGAQVSLLLTDDAEVRALNAKWRGQDKSTNVLSFPCAGPDRLPRSPTSPPPLWGRIKVGGRADLDRVTVEGADQSSEASATPHPCPPPQEGAGAPAAAVSTLQQRALGDIALAFETLAREARASGVSLADHYRHLVAHGFLHLIGYDHETDEDAERMEALETQTLVRLGVGDPYADGAAGE